MFRNLLKFILWVTSTIIIIAGLLLFYFKFIVINKDFYRYTLPKNNIYENLSKGIKGAVIQLLRSQVSSSKEYDKMTVGERQEIDRQINDYISFINKDTVGDFISGNVDRSINYFNNKSPTWYVYLPLNKWDLPVESYDQIPEYLKTTDVDLRIILTQQNKNNDSYVNSINNLKYLAKNTTLGLLLVLIITVLIILFYILISKKGHRIQSLGKLFTFHGLFILILSWIFFTTLNIFLEGSSYKTQWSDLLAGILVPIYIRPLLLIFTVFGMIFFFTGIYLFNKRNKLP